MTESIDREFTVKAIRFGGIVDDEYVRNGWVVLNECYSFSYPVDCFELVQENKMKVFSKGDVVEVIKRVDRENGWDNDWVGSMNTAIGREYTVDRVENTGIYFVPNNDDIFSNYADFGFPPSSLRLIVNSKTKIATDPVIKYQYFRGSDYSRKYNGLCLTIATKLKISKFTGEKTIEWTVSFKHPRDQFDKALARESVNKKTPKLLFVSDRYTRNEIVVKILADLVYNDYFLSDEYRKFVRLLLNEYSGSI